MSKDVFHTVFQLHMPGKYIRKIVIEDMHNPSCIKFHVESTSMPKGAIFPEIDKSDGKLVSKSDHSNDHIIEIDPELVSVSSLPDVEDIKEDVVISKIEKSTVAQEASGGSGASGVNPPLKMVIKLSKTGKPSSSSPLSPPEPFFAPIVIYSDSEQEEAMSVDDSSKKSPPNVPGNTRSLPPISETKVEPEDVEFQPSTSEVPSDDEVDLFLASSPKKPMMQIVPSHKKPESTKVLPPVKDVWSKIFSAEDEIEIIEYVFNTSPPTTAEAASNIAYWEKAKEHLYEIVKPSSKRGYTYDAELFLKFFLEVLVDKIASLRVLHTQEHRRIANIIYKQCAKPGKAKEKLKDYDFFRINGSQARI